MDNRYIVIDKQSTDDDYEDFVSLMTKSEDTLNQRCALDDTIRHLTPSQIESYATTCIKDSCSGTRFSPNDIILVSHNIFPDIIASGKYGVEVKSTKSDHWTSIGSSILESTRPASVEKIYMLFGKLGGEVRFKCRPYQEVLTDITVTHSPRYLIDMKLGSGETIFDKMKIPYDTLRTSDNAISMVRRYYRHQRSDFEATPWWLTNEEDEEGAGIGVRTWDSLDHHEKEDVKSMMLLLFAGHIVHSKYKPIALWAVATKSILLYNARDIFSAGGVITYLVTPNGERKALKHPIPRSYSYIVNGATTLRHKLLYDTKFFKEVSQYAAEYCPDLDNSTPSKLYNSWLNSLEELGCKVPLGKFIRENLTLI